MKLFVMLTLCLNLALSPALFATDSDEWVMQIAEFEALLPSGESTWAVDLDTPEIYEWLQVRHVKRPFCQDLNYSIEVYVPELQEWYKATLVGDSYQMEGYMIDAVRVTFERPELFGAFCKVSLFGRVMTASI